MTLVPTATSGGAEMAARMARQVKVADKPKLISITDCTEEEKGLGFVIMLGNGKDKTKK